MTDQLAADSDQGPSSEPRPNQAANAGLIEDGLRYTAVKEHRKRALRQIRSAALIVLLIALAPPLRTFLCDIAAGTAEFKWLSARLPDEQIPPIIGNLNYLFFLVWVAYFGFLQWYMRERGKDWRENVQQANSSDPEECARGYMAVFRMYARTKRRATFTLLWGVSALYVGGWGIFLAIDNGASWMILSSSIEIAAGVAVISMGIYISQRFLPGKVLIGHTLKLSIRAAASNTALIEAQKEAEHIEIELKQDRPWWYY